MKPLTGYDGVFWTEDFDDVQEIAFIFDKTSQFNDRVLNVMFGDTETSNGVAVNGIAIGFDGVKYQMYQHYRDLMDWHVDPERYKTDEKYRWIIDHREHVSTMYMWQWGIDDPEHDRMVVFVGRDLNELTDFLCKMTDEINRQRVNGSDKVSEMKRQIQIHAAKKGNRKSKCRVYFHNLSFDIAELSNIFREEFAKRGGGRSRTFARSPRRPMKTAAELNNIMIEFRDSFILTNKKLLNWGKDENLPVQKIEKPSEYYDKIRHPGTKLTEEEYEYAIVDIVTGIYGIRKFVERFGSLYKIPLTATSIVRQDARIALAEDPDWGVSQLEVQQSYNYDFFLKLTKLYTGGWTHANARYTNKIISIDDPEADIIAMTICHDFASSYPFQLTTASNYQTGPFKEVDTKLFNEYFKDRSIKNCKTIWFGRFRISKVKSKLDNSFFSYSKCLDFPKLVKDETNMKKGERYRLDNGRVRATDYMECYMSDVDWDIFRRAYNFKCIECIELYEAPCGRLSTTLIEFILEAYRVKTSCKSDPSKYRAAKERVNSIYGVACTKIVSDIVEYCIDGTWKSDGTPETMQKQFAKIIEKTKPENMINCYGVGIWCCKNAMHALWEFIIKFDKKVVYCDTDSLKGLLNKQDLKFIDEYNKNVEKMENEIADELGFPRDMFAPKTEDGVTKRLGLFEREHDCLTYSVLGAKRYYCEFMDKVKDKKGKKHEFRNHETTIAGLPKKAGYKKIKSAKQFLNPVDTVFDVNESMKKGAFYNDNQKPVKWIDYQGNTYISDEQFTCCIMPVTFDLKMASNFENFLDMCEGRTTNPFKDDPDDVLFADVLFMN